MAAISERPAQPPREYASNAIQPFPTGVAPLIVGFDGSTSATAAVAWAGATGIPVIVVRVVGRGRSRADPRNIGIDETALVLGDHARIVADSLAGSPWRAELLEASSPAAALAAVARRHGATAIVVGSHGHARRHAVLGTAPHQLLADAGVPVVVIPRQERPAGPRHRCVRAGRT